MSIWLRENQCEQVHSVLNVSALLGVKQQTMR